MRTYDAIIVGGGPSGCAAAYDLATAGLDVLILDKHEFPRSKPCAGALTIKSLRRLRYGIDPVIRVVVSDKVAGLKGRRESLLKSKSPICVTTIRRELDEFCLNQTLRQGAAFEVIPGIQSIDQEKDSLTLTDSEGHAYHGRYLIGADGVHSQVRKITREFKPERTAFAIEGIVPLEKCQSSPSFTFDYGVVQDGYAWLIPKHDHVNVGLYTYGDSSQIRKKSLREYAEKNLDTGTVEHMRGFPIGIGGETYVPQSPRIFLVGDAAGFADPLLGEGIHNAIKSGQAAATAIIDAILSGADANLAYRAAIEDIRQDVCNCRKISYLFYKQLSISYALLKSRGFQTRLLKGFAQGMTMTEIRKTFFI